MLDVALGVGAEIEHDEVVVAQRRQQGGQRRPVDAGHRPQRQLGHRHQGAGIAARNRGLGLAFLHRGDGAAHRGGLGTADRLARLFVAGDDVVAMDDLAGRGEALVPVDFLADRGLVAEQEKGQVAAALEGAGGAGDHHGRAGVATHRVDCDTRPTRTHV